MVLYLKQEFLSPPLKCYHCVYVLYLVKYISITN